MRTIITATNPKRKSAPRLVYNYFSVEWYFLALVTTSLHKTCPISSKMSRPCSATRSRDRPSPCTSKLSTHIILKRCNSAALCHILNLEVVILHPIIAAQQDCHMIPTCLEHLSPSHQCFRFNPTCRLSSRFLLCNISNPLSGKESGMPRLLLKRRNATSFPHESPAVFLPILSIMHVQSTFAPTNL